MNPQCQAWRNLLVQCRHQLGDVMPFQAGGRLTRINGLVMEASGLKVALGASCRVQIPGDGTVP